VPVIADSVLIRHLAPKNFLSFGPDNAGIELQALNLFIGPNGSGKSNLIEAISLMRSAPKTLRDVTRKGGGVAEWIWKGNARDSASVEMSVRFPEGAVTLRHLIEFRAESQALSVVRERVQSSKGRGKKSDLKQWYEYTKGSRPLIQKKDKPVKTRVAIAAFEENNSILAQRRDPETYPQLAWLAANYESIRIYREWSFGSNSAFRKPQQADMRSDRLEEDLSNLGLFLNRLKSRFPAAKKAILAGLKDLYAGISDFDVSVDGGTVQVFFAEGDFVIPATRLSDGTLRYLCLLAILCDPEPPPLICIEEPELGLHPDILPGLADLLKEASERTQLIVTTHSDILVDAMTETPECVVVCEKHEGKTEMTRLSGSELKVWLEKYRLGELWIRGHLGGKRW